MTPSPAISLPPVVPVGTPIPIIPPSSGAGVGVVGAFEFERTGEFKCRTFGEYHCSTLEVPTIRYYVFMSAVGDPLDSRGFMFDQLDCPQYFGGIESTDLSCELLTERACKEIRDLATRENPHLHVSLVVVKLSPEPYGITITYKISTPTPQP